MEYDENMRHIHFGCASQFVKKPKYLEDLLGPLEIDVHRPSGTYGILIGNEELGHAITF